MSKGHLEAMAALKVMRAKTGPASKAPVTKSETVTQTVTRTAKGGRGQKVHTSTADKQKAYRARKKAKA